MAIRLYGVENATEITKKENCFLKPSENATIEWLILEHFPYTAHLVRVISYAPGHSITFVGINRNTGAEMKEFTLADDPRIVWSPPPSTLSKHKLRKEEYAILFIEADFADMHQADLAAAQSDTPNKWPRGSGALFELERFKAKAREFVDRLGDEEKCKKLFVEMFASLL